MRGYPNTRTQTHARESKENREDKKHSHRLAGPQNTGGGSASERASERYVRYGLSSSIRDETGAEKQNKTRRESEREWGGEPSGGRLGVITHSDSILQHDERAPGG